MFNPQYLAVRIEHKLHAKGYVGLHAADQIRSDPMGVMDTVLRRYENLSEENDTRSADFWEKYEQYKGCRLDEFGEEVAEQFVKDVCALFE